MVHIVYTMDKNALKILQMNKTPWKNKYGLYTL